VSDADGLVAFLRARLDEWRAAVEAADADDVPQPFEGHELGTCTTCDEARAVNVAVVTMPTDPADFVLADIEAKRRIVDGIAGADPHSGYITGTFTAWDVLHLLALPHAGHPDFRPEWRP
jgi:hypothetical protein